MPELPEVETVRRTIARRAVGRVITSVWTSGKLLHGRVVPARELARNAVGRVIDRIDRRGKYLLVHLGGDHVMVLHLGMSGQLRHEATATKVAIHTHLRLALNGGAELRFVDPRRFGQIDIVSAEALDDLPAIRSMGPEPLGRRFSGRHLAKVLATSRRPIKTALLDQTVVAGIGNIYASESLFEAGLDPRREGRGFPRHELDALAKATKRILTQAIRARGTTLNDYRDGDGAVGGYQHRLRVFGRAGETCRRCGSVIARIVQAGRSTFACFACQT